MANTLVPLLGSIDSTQEAKLINAGVIELRLVVEPLALACKRYDGKWFYSHDMGDGGADEFAPHRKDPMLWRSPVRRR